MKRAWTLAAALLLMSVSIGQVFGQAETPKTKLSFGPIIGVTGIIVDPVLFNTTMQVVYPTTDREYFPAFTELGLQALQVVPMGDSKSSLAFHEMFFVGGLDQNMPIPSLNLILAYRTALGIEFGIGPFFSLTAPEGKVKIAASVIFEAGWSISLSGFSVPIMLTFVPLPSYANPQVSLLVGFAFESTE